jgi:hypothetical protein
MLSIPYLCWMGCPSSRSIQRRYLSCHCCPCPNRLPPTPQPSQDTVFRYPSRSSIHQRSHVGPEPDCDGRFNPAPSKRSVIAWYRDVQGFDEKWRFKSFQNMGVVGAKQDLAEGCQSPHSVNDGKWLQRSTPLLCCNPDELQPRTNGESLFRKNIQGR